MARRPTPRDESRPELVKPREEVKALVAAQVEKAQPLLGKSISSRHGDHHARAWYEYTEEVLKHIATNDKLADEFAGRGLAFASYDDDLSVDKYLRKLTSIYNRLDVIDEAPSVAATRATPGRPTARKTKRVFIIHGHDTANRLTLQKLLKEEWELEPVVLLDLPGGSRTLIERIEQEAGDVGYAIAILTPDDLTRTAKAGPEGAEYYEARPNVLLELGWLLHALGRDHVVMLVKAGTQLPSDLGGVSHQLFRDSVEEKVLPLRNELRKAGLIP